MAYIAVVYEGNIVRLIQVGEGAQWTLARARETRALAMIYASAFSRSGDLVASHKVAQNRDIYTGRFRKGWNVYADARHAAWVHGGTAGNGGGYIYPTGGKAMVLPPGGGYPRLVRKRVRGQEAKPWLREAGEAIAHRYG